MNKNDLNGTKQEMKERFRIMFVKWNNHMALQYILNSRIRHSADETHVRGEDYHFTGPVITILINFYSILLNSLQSSLSPSLFIIFFIF